MYVCTFLFSIFIFAQTEFHVLKTLSVLPNIQIDVFKVYENKKQQSFQLNR